MADKDEKSGLSAYFGGVFAAGSKIKFHGGVVGKLCLVLIFAFVAMAAIAWAPNMPVAIVGLVLVTLIILVLGWRMISYAEKNPYTSSLDGAELLQHQHLQMGMKGQPVVPYVLGNLTSDPSSPVPRLTDARSMADDPPEDDAQPVIATSESAPHAVTPTPLLNDDADDDKEGAK